ncbi:hypothetical protein NC796_00255 [Aliifodinibius sp. S!AR15-10]|uniref:hypothetical protein n=1 Tax=Aliifodinibius sp. S!AR15-10 TaxID=2950437 RepID=UPI002859A49F|nr:hypothetical protein [Aliifodinibius sp. S!AR15-10]MDR8389544.1 hypothetical protein [Aliifodinibius sp. S!AR15-10]
MIITSILLGFILILLGSSVMAQEEEDQENEMFRVDFVKPKINQVSAFEDALIEHNNKFHKDFPVFIAFNVTGQYAGYYGAYMGPLTWTEWEARETTEAHDKHWLDVVLPLCDQIAETQFWRRLPRFETNPLEESSEKSIVTVLSVEQGEFPRFMRTLEEWHETNQKSKDFDGSYNVYTRWFDNPDQIAIVGNLEEGLAEFDEQRDFRNRYEEQHGKQNWDLWLDDSIISISSINEVLRIHRYDLSTKLEE